MKNSQILEVIKVTEKESKEDNPRNYKVCEIISYESCKTIHPLTGTEIMGIGKVVSSTKNIWEHAPSNNGERGKYNHDYKLWKKDYTRLGRIEKREVVPYSIGEGEKARTVDTTSVVVLGDTTDKRWEERVNLAFKEAGYTLKNNNKVEEVEDVLSPSSAFSG